MYEVPESAQEAISNDLTLAQDLEALRVMEISPYPTTVRIHSKLIAKLNGEKPFLMMEPEWYLEIDPTSWPAKVERLNKTYAAESHDVDAVKHVFKRIVCRLRGLLELQMKSNNAYRNLVVYAGVMAETDWGSSKTAHTYGVLTKYNKKGVPYYRQFISPKDADEPHKQFEDILG